MRILIQRVLNACVIVNNITVGEIDTGILVLLGIADDDDEKDIDWLINKMIHLRIFNDNDGIMNLSVGEVGGDILIVSQFTLYASTKKGNRPSYINAAKPDIAKLKYDTFVKRLRLLYSGKVQEGRFAADMKVNLINDGPVTIWIDSKNRE